MALYAEERHNFPYYYRFNEQSIWYKNYWPGAAVSCIHLKFLFRKQIKHKANSKRLISFLSNSPTTLRMFIYQHAKSFSYGRNVIEERIIMCSAVSVCLWLLNRHLFTKFYFAFAIKFSTLYSLSPTKFVDFGGTLSMI
jgi:hypothetical protein